MFIFSRISRWCSKLSNVALFVGLLYAIMAFLELLAYIAMFVYRNAFVKALRQSEHANMFNIKYLQTDIHQVVCVILVVLMAFKVINIVTSIRLIHGIPQGSEAVVQHLSYDAIALNFKFPTSLLLLYMASSTTDVPIKLCMSFTAVTVTQCLGWLLIFILYQFGLHEIANKKKA